MTHPAATVLEKPSKAKLAKISTNENEVLNLVYKRHFDLKNIFEFIKNMSALTDNEISECLNLNVKTYRTYHNSSKATKNASPTLVEHAYMLLALINHGNDVFGNQKNFAEWLRTENFHFGKKPIDYLNTINGIKYTNDRLTGLEYGDNA